MKEKTFKFWIYIVVGFVAIILIGLVLLTTVQLFKIKSLKRQEAKLSTRLNELLQTQSYYENANVYVNSNEFIEQYARDVLKFGQDGDRH